MSLTFNSNIDPTRCTLCDLIIPPNETFLVSTVTDVRCCSACVEGLLVRRSTGDAAALDAWQEAVSQRKKVLEGLALPEGDTHRTFFLSDYQNNRQILEARFLDEVFEVECQNQVGHPIVFTLKERSPDSTR